MSTTSKPDGRRAHKIATVGGIVLLHRVRRASVVAAAISGAVFLVLACSGSGRSGNSPILEVAAQTNWRATVVDDPSDSSRYIATFEWDHNDMANPVIDKTVSTNPKAAGGVCDPASG